MKKVLCLVSSPPGSAQAQRAFALAEEWVKQGHSVQICLLQDGVYAALQSKVQDDTVSPVQWLVLGDDLKLRGFAAEDLRSGVTTLDHAGLVQMMLENFDQVLGAF